MKPKSKKKELFEDEELEEEGLADVELDEELEALDDPDLPEPDDETW